MKTIRIKEIKRRLEDSGEYRIDDSTNSLYHYNKGAFYFVGRAGVRDIAALAYKVLKPGEKLPNVYIKGL